MLKSSVSASQIIKVSDKEPVKSNDLLAVEEPLEIRLGYGDQLRKEKPVSVTMRTPGQDFELVRGFLFTEGIINSSSDVLSMRYCEATKPEEKGNVVRAELSPRVDIDFHKLERHFYTSSSCGVCGKSSIDAVQSKCSMISSNLKVDESVIHKAPNILREAQRIFEHTGGLHAAALFSDRGELVLMSEDVGRHNALDKLIGNIISSDIQSNDHFVLVSGRASFELIQKAVMAGIPILAAVGAPSSLAVQLAKESKMTLLGFVRNDNFNIYCGDQRIITKSNYS